jgi:argininosuccinate synthase
MKVYAPWRDPELLKEFPGRTEMVDYLDKAGIKTPLVGKKRYSTDANLAGISYEAEDLESVTTPSTIVEPQMGVWPADAPDTAEEVSIRFEGAEAVELNGKAMSPLELMQTASEIAGRNGIGIKNALENRILGTKSRGVYEAPGMELLSCCLQQVYFAVFEKRATALFTSMSSLVATQVYEARTFDPSTNAALAAINSLTEHAQGTVQMALYKGNIHFLGLTDCPASLYNEADSSMESSEGLNPVSSQGYAEIQAIEAKALAYSGQIKS